VPNSSTHTKTILGNSVELIFSRAVCKEDLALIIEMVQAIAGGREAL
jgi:hypothetical protein